MCLKRHACGSGDRGVGSLLRIEFYPSSQPQHVAKAHAGMYHTYVIAVVLIINVVVKQRRTPDPAEETVPLRARHRPDVNDGITVIPAPPQVSRK